MRVYVYPGDRHGCGMFRLIWPGECLRDAGYDVKVIDPASRWDIGVHVNRVTGEAVEAFCPDDADVIVMQRVTHRHLVSAIPMWQAREIAVVVDVDDDLSAIHPSNPAFSAFHAHQDHDWQNLKMACRAATLVTVSSDALAARYGGRDKTRVIRNYLPDHYYGIERVDSDLLGWPAAISSHPNDPQTLGGSLNRLSREFNVPIRVLGTGPEDVSLYRRELRLTRDPELSEPVPVQDWPAWVASLGVGIAPLADTRFNAAKSYLKPLEMSAVGVPWVGSPRTEYRRFVTETGVGILAERAGEWYRALRRLITDETARKEFSEAGREAAERFRIRDHAWRWLEAWERARELANVGPPGEKQPLSRRSQAKGLRSRRNRQPG